MIVEYIHLQNVYIVYNTDLSDKVRVMHDFTHLRTHKRTVLLFKC